jgi:DNA-binding NarL/FixJ family response regulator
VLRVLQMNAHGIIRILVVDHNAIVREGIRTIIDRQSDMSVIAETSDGRNALELFRQHCPDIVLTELRLPTACGVQLCNEILNEGSDSRIIVFTDRTGDEDIYRSLQAGARSYLFKNASPDELLEAIRAVHSGLHHLPTEVAARLAARINGSALSAREIEVLRLIVSGKSNKQVAANLSITEGTVKGHVNNILSKLCVSDRTQAVVTALRRGIVTLD